MSRPNTVVDLEITVDYGQLYVSGAPLDQVDPDTSGVLRALDDARGSGRYVGVAGGLIDLVTPIQYSANAPMRVETWPGEPVDDRANWDHVVDVDLDVRDGRMFFEASGGWEPVSCEVPTGNYRARLSARGYDQADVEGLDAYRIQLWPRASASPPGLRKSWPGWQNAR
jgi:hypothetical protein